MDPALVQEDHAHFVSAVRRVQTRAGNDGLYLFSSPEFLTLFFTKLGMVFCVGRERTADTFCFVSPAPLALLLDLRKTHRQHALLVNDANPKTSPGGYALAVAN